ncbi:aldehyde dehydrogenase family protein [Daeguia caeni]|uniref:Aldehyde dehydrogenase family protein n=1 Tax=Daeguia caeni TaxID=439612 RepID=A0ABV9H2Y2_9HYPH
MLEAAKYNKLLINGEWVDAPSHFPVLDKFTGETIAEVAAATEDQVNRAVAIAKEAVEGEIPAPHARSAILYKAAQLLDQYKDAFRDVMVAEAGFTLIDAANEVQRARLTLELSAETAKMLCGHVVPFGAHPGSEKRIGFTVREPVGVVCAITPFNSPLNTVLHKVGPSFAAGNPTVLKPSSLTPLTSGLLGHVLLEAGMPAAYLHIIQGEGDVGELLLKHQDIAFYTFTGSTRVGRIIQQHAGLRRTQMELGSIASTIICEDADLDQALPKVINAGMRKAGQVCTSVQRLLVHESVYPAVVEKLTALAKTMKAGNPKDDSVKVGPMITEAAAKRAEEWIKSAVEAGATLHCGGSREGSVLQPAVLTNVPETASVWCNEAFAPIIAVKPFSDFNEAIATANNTPFGLAAGVFTKNMDRAMLAMRKLRFGTVQINETSSARADVMPFGGVKDSGFGKEGPHYAALEMTIERLMVLNP